MEGPALMVQECRRHIPRIFCSGEERLSIQLNPTNLDRPQHPELRRQRGAGAGSGYGQRSSGVGQQQPATAPSPSPSLPRSIPFKPGRRPQIPPSLQIRPPIFIPSPSQIARSLAPSISQQKKRRIAGQCRQIHPLPCLPPPLPPWSKEAGGHRLPSTGLGCQPTPPWQPPHNSASSFSGHPQPGDQPGQQGKEGQVDNRRQLLLLLVGRIWLID